MITLNAGIPKSTARVITAFLLTLILNNTLAPALTENSTAKKITALTTQEIANKVFFDRPSFGIPYIKVYSEDSKLIYASDHIREMVENDDLFKDKNETSRTIGNLKQDLNLLRIELIRSKYTVLYYTEPLYPGFGYPKLKALDYLNTRLGKDFRLIMVEVHYQDQ